MNFRKLVPGLSVAEQISVADMPAIVAAGFRTLVCNRPDGEAEGQPRYLELERAAMAHGLQIYCLPVISGQVQDHQAVQMAQVLAGLPGPVLAFCRTGTRSTVLWALSAAGEMEVDEILARAAAAGYDLSAMRGRLEQLAAGNRALDGQTDQLMVCPGVASVPAAAAG